MLGVHRNSPHEAEVVHTRSDPEGMGKLHGAGAQMPISPSCYSAFPLATFSPQVRAQREVSSPRPQYWVRFPESQPRAPPLFHSIWNPVSKTMWNELDLNHGKIPGSIHGYTTLLPFCHSRKLNSLGFYILMFGSALSYEWRSIIHSHLINIQNKFSCVASCAFGMNICQRLDST